MRTGEFTGWTETLPRDGPAALGIWTRDDRNRISVVDDDISIRDSARSLLGSMGYRVATFASAELFLQSGALSETECIVLDIGMPGMGGLELQRHLRTSNKMVPIVFVTADDDAINRQEALEGGAVDFLCKPFQAVALMRALGVALTARASTHHRA